MTTLTLNPTQDTFYWNGVGNIPDRNYGVRTDLFVGENGDSQPGRILIKPDLSSLPSTAIISSAVLSLWLETNGGATTRTLRVFRCKRAWTEGTGDNTIPDDGATWNKYDGTNAWETGGGFGANDCEQTDIGSLSITSAHRPERIWI